MGKLVFSGVIFWASPVFGGESFFLPQKWVTQPETKVAPPSTRLTVDLSAPPEKRWKTAIMTLEQHSPGAIQAFINDSATIMQKLDSAVMRGISTIFEKRWPTWWKEQQGAAQVLKSDLKLKFDEDRLLMVNMFYAFTHLKGAQAKACTAIIGVGKDGNLWHGHNFDYIPKSAAKVSRQVQFVRDGRPLFTATIMIPAVLIPVNGVSQHSFSYNINSRDTTLQTFTDVITRLLAPDTVPAPLLGRLVMETCTSYEEAKTMLSSHKLITEAYYVLAGQKEGAVITRDAHTINRIRVLGADLPRQYLVQTNEDYWTGEPVAPASDRRRKAVNTLLSAEPPSKPLPERLFKVLTTPSKPGRLGPFVRRRRSSPRCTLSTCVMSPTTKEVIFKTTYDLNPEHGVPQIFFRRGRENI